MNLETTDTGHLSTYALANNSGVNMNTRTRAGGLQRHLAAATLKAVGVTCLIAGLGLASAFFPLVDMLLAVATISGVVWAIPRINRATDEQLQRVVVPAARLFLLVVVGLAVGAVLMSQGLLPAPSWSAFG